PLPRPALFPYTTLFRSDPLPVALHVPQRLVADPDDAVVELLQRHQEPQDVGLARPARPDERHALAGLHGEVELAEHDVLAEPLDHLLEADAGGGAPRQRRGGPAALRLVLLRAVLLHAVLLRGHAFRIIGR